MNRLHLGLILAILLVTPAQAADNPLLGGEDTQDVLVLTPKRPFLLRLHIYVDGKPFPGRWQEFMGKLFALLDRDGDGSLDKDEAQLLPPSPQLLQFFQTGTLGAAQAPPDFAEVDANKNGKISREEFLAYYRRSGAGPVAVNMPAGTGNMAGPLTDILFRTLDENRDGKLSREELLKAETLLRALDENDDEVITPEELLAAAAPGMRQPPQGTPFPAYNPREQTTLVLIPREEPGKLLDNRIKAARDLIKHYDRNANQKVSQSEIGFPKALFDLLGPSITGDLETTQLVRWLLALPDAEITLRLGQPEGKESLLDLHPRREGAPASFTAPRKVSDSSLTLPATGLEMEFSLGGLSRPQATIRSFYLQQFKMADRDQKGLVRIKDLNAPQTTFLQQIARLADADGDGKLTLAELESWVELNQAAMGCQTILTLLDQGEGLFELLDTNHDGRLGLREMRQAVRLLSYDLNGDGCIDRQELPRQCKIVATQGLPTAGAFPQLQAVQPGMVANTAPEARRGPAWFLKMDVNRDGDVSPREFLGSPEDFARIDTDGDGLISVEEAERYQAKK